MSSSYHSAPAQRVPAWKRLGLKLKGPASGESPTATLGTAAVANPPTTGQRHNVAGVKGNNAPSPASALKRKLPSHSTQSAKSSSVETPSKRIRTETQTPASRKSVAFAEGTKDPSSPTAVATADTAKKSKKKKKKTKSKPKKAAKAAAEKTDTNLEPSLTYLRQWHTDRASWKFNKNHQTLLIKYLFDADKVPSADIPIFYSYIRDLKGFIRTRLRETAEDIRKKDMEQGVEGFPAAPDRENRQKVYDDLLTQFLEEQQQRRRQQNRPSSGTTNVNGKRTFDEVELAIRTADPAIKARLIKRIRAEMVIEELSDSESSDSTETATTTATTSSASSGRDAAASAPAATHPPAAKRTDSQQPTKRRRLRNVRTNVSDDDEDDSSSSSESSDSEGEDEESSSDSEESSDEDSSSDEDMEGVEDVPDVDSSSSSSSSSSESGSDDESDGTDNEAGSAGGEESEESEESEDSDSD